MSLFVETSSPPFLEARPLPLRQAQGPAARSESRDWNELEVKQGGEPCSRAAFPVNIPHSLFFIQYSSVLSGNFLAASQLEHSKLRIGYCTLILSRTQRGHYFSQRAPRHSQRSPGIFYPDLYSPYFLHTSLSHSSLSSLHGSLLPPFQRYIHFWQTNVIHSCTQF